MQPNNYDISPSQLPYKGPQFVTTILYMPWKQNKKLDITQITNLTVLKFELTALKEIILKIISKKITQPK